MVTAQPPNVFSFTFFFFFFFVFIFDDIENDSHVQGATYNCTFPYLLSSLIALITTFGCRTSRLPLEQGTRGCKICVLNAMHPVWLQLRILIKTAPVLCFLASVLNLNSSSSGPWWDRWAILMGALLLLCPVFWGSFWCHQTYVEMHCEMHLKIC